MKPVPLNFQNQEQMKWRVILKSIQFHQGVSINTEDSAVSPVVISVRIEITEVIVAIIPMAAKIIATRKIFTAPTMDMVDQHIIRFVIEPLQTGVA